MRWHLLQVFGEGEPHFLPLIRSPTPPYAFLRPLHLLSSSVHAFARRSLTLLSQHVADRLDKLEAFLAECDGDERYHLMYGDWESYKAKRVTRKKGELEDTRWQWIDRRKPEM